jgi:CheY-like chemotaxis protein
LTLLASSIASAASVSAEDLLTVGWAPRSLAALLGEQLAAMRVFHHDRNAAELAAVASGMSREQRLDAHRRLDVVRRQHHALVSATQESLDRSGFPLYRPGPRVLVVHRNEWLRRRVAEELAELGIKVVAQLDNGADGVGALVAEQPDLLLVEDALPQVTGMQMLAATRRYAPHTRTAMQVPYDDGLAPALDAGAAAVFTRRTPPADIALQLARLVATS